MLSIKKILLIGLFFVLPIMAADTVLTSTDFTFPNTMPGNKIKVQKVWDNVAKKIKIKYNPIGMNAEEIEKLNKTEEDFLHKKHGNVRGKLRNKLSGCVIISV